MEMAWCTDKGIPHSVLLDWDSEDRAKLHAYLLEESLRCVMCGTQPWEWDPEQGGSRRAYIPVELFCPGCYAKQTTADGNDAPKGTTIQLVPHSETIVEEQRQRYLKEQRRKAEGGRGLHSRPESRHP
jgi:hypothetical protein